MECLDSAPARSEYKLLQLRQCLSGEALNDIKDLGHSATALILQINGWKESLEVSAVKSQFILKT